MSSPERGPDFESTALFRRVREAFPHVGFSTPGPVPLALIVLDYDVRILLASLAQALTLAR